MALTFAAALLTVGVAVAPGNGGSNPLAGQGDGSTPNEVHPIVSPPMPKLLDFAGEPVPMDNVDVYERLERELVINTHYHSSTILALKNAGRWVQPMKRILREEGVPEDFFYLMVAESGVRNARSYVGAQGFWQFMESTARQYGLEVSATVDERNHPVKACRAACAYLNDSYNTYKSWTLAAAAYNMGKGNLNYNLRTQQDSSYYNLHLNPETERYVFRVISFKLIFQNPTAYGFGMKTDDLYRPIPTRTVETKTSIPDLMAFARAQGTTYRMLKVLNPWLTSTKLIAQPGKTYGIELPYFSVPVGEKDGQ